MVLRGAGMWSYTPGTTCVHALLPLAGPAGRPACRQAVQSLTAVIMSGLHHCGVRMYPVHVQILAGTAVPVAPRRRA
jgi:hypothetical protein